MREKVYISGKITGLPIDEAKRNFKNCADYLRDEGYEVVNPMELPEHEAILAMDEMELVEDGKWYLHMKADIKAMMDCDSIFVMLNYTESKGAMIEYKLAMELGLHGMYQNNSTAYLTTKQAPPNNDEA